MKKKHSPFLWINKDASNIHSKSHAPVVSSHVQVGRSKKLRAPIFVRHLTWSVSPDSKGREESQSLTSPFVSPAPAPLSRHETLHEQDSSFRERCSDLRFLYRLQEKTIKSGDDVTQTQTQTQQKPQISAHSALSSAFDLFTPFVGPISQDDKRLLHYYFVMVPTIYGTTPTTTYCPVRDGTYPESLTDPITRQWALLAAEVKTSHSNDTSSILRRRTYVYHLMGRTLADRAKRRNSATIVGLGSAAVVESRLGDFQRARMHFKALQGLLEERGGLRTARDLPLCMTTILMIAFMGMVGYEEPFHNMAEMEDRKRQSIEGLKSMAKWNEVRAGENLLSSEQVSIHAELALLDDASQIRSKNAADSYAFSEISPLRPYIEKDAPLGSDVTQILIHFIVLYSINFTLWEFRDRSPEMTDRFLNLLLKDVYSAVSETSQQSLLKITTVALMVFNRSAEVGERNGIRDGLWRLLKILDVVRIMQLVSPIVWKRLTHVMSAWLTGEESDAINEEEWENIDVEVTMKWLFNRSNP